MTFLSRLRLHPRDLLVISDLADITGFHRTLMRAFPQHNGGAARAKFGVLFRLEPRSNPPIPIWPPLSCNVGLSAMAPDSDPTSVTSSPSRIQVIPSAHTTSQWKRAQAIPWLKTLVFVRRTPG